jgi:hypothetical protein
MFSEGSGQTAASQARVHFWRRSLGGFAAIEQIFPACNVRDFVTYRDDG